MKMDVFHKHINELYAEIAKLHTVNKTHEGISLIKSQDTEC